MTPHLPTWLHAKESLSILKSLAIFAAFLFSIVSYIGICTEACRQGFTYHLFGVHFETIGILLFGVASVATLLQRFELFALLANLIILGSLGGEVMLVYVQKYWIKHWCPVCLSIAASVAVAGCALGVEYLLTLFNLIRTHQKEEYMKKVHKGLLGLFILLCGFLVVFFGISKEDSLNAAENDIKANLAFSSSKRGLPVSTWRAIQGAFWVKARRLVMRMSFCEWGLWLTATKKRSRVFHFSGSVAIESMSWRS